MNVLMLGPKRYCLTPTVFFVIWTGYRMSDVFVSDANYF